MFLKRTLTAAAVLAMFSSPVFAQDPSFSEAFCKGSQKEFKKINEQLPIDMDYMTQLIGVRALHTSGNDTCNITINFGVETDKFIQAFIEGTEGQFNEQQSIQFMNSQQGRKLFTQIFKEQAETDYADYNLPDVNTVVRYDMDSTQVDSFTIELFN